MSSPYFNFKLPASLLHDLLMTLMNPSAGAIRGTSIKYNDDCTEATIKVDYHYDNGTNPASMSFTALLTNE